MAMLPLCSRGTVSQLACSNKWVSGGVWFSHQAGEQTACIVENGGNRVLMLTSLCSYKTKNAVLAGICFLPGDRNRRVEGFLLFSELSVAVINHIK